MTTPTDFTNFKIDTSDILGFNYQSYCSDMRAMAMNSPSEYSKVRKVVMDAVIRDAVSNIYITFFNVLTKGADKGGSHIPGFVVNGTRAKPGYPSNKVSDFAQEAAEVMTKYCMDCVNIILPEDYHKLSEQKLTLKGKAAGIDA